jgi:uncharacterized coiled-coil DUF342 family protein
MNALIQYLNLAGVMAMACLCLVQWRANRAVNLEVNALEKTRLEQSATIQKVEKEAKGSQADLEALREHFARTSLESKEANSNLARIELERDQLRNERDQLRQSVTNWANAVSARDAQLKQLGERVKSMAAERNETVVKFNELAEKYNGVVRDLNERTRQFNELVQRVKQEGKKE